MSDFQAAYILTINWQPQDAREISSVSMAPASRNISTLTSCQQIGNLFGQHGSSFTEYQHTHELSTDWQCVRSAWLQLHGISAHSHPVNRLAICSVSMAPASRNISTLTSCQQMAICAVSMAPASRNISTLTSCQQIGNVFGQHGSSFTEYQHTHELS